MARSHLWYKIVLMTLGYYQNLQVSYGENILLRIYCIFVASILLDRNVIRSVIPQNKEIFFEYCRYLIFFIYCILSKENFSNYYRQTENYHYQSISSKSIFIKFHKCFVVYFLVSLTYRVGYALFLCYSGVCLIFGPAYLLFLTIEGFAIETSLSVNSLILCIVYCQVIIFKNYLSCIGSIAISDSIDLYYFIFNSFRSVEKQVKINVRFCVLGHAYNHLNVVYNK